VALCRTGFSLITCAASQLFFNITPILGEILRARSAVAKATQLAAIMDNDDFVLVERRGECFFLVSKWHPSADLCAKDGEPEQGNDNVLSGMVSPNSLDKSELIPVVTTEELERIRSGCRRLSSSPKGANIENISVHIPQVPETGCSIRTSTGSGMTLELVPYGFKGFQVAASRLSLPI
jgi:hypothetical protein